MGFRSIGFGIMYQGRDAVFLQLCDDVYAGITRMSGTFSLNVKPNGPRVRP